MNIANYIREIKDFPKPGIIFKDITPLLNDADAAAFTTQSLLNISGHLQIDRVVGIESRGFFFAMLLAQELKAGFVPVRKPGKLPAETISKTYALEYGQDTLEIHKDAIKSGDKVLVHDDVLATGGTAKAVCDLIEQLGGEVVQCNFIMEIEALQGREKLKDYNVRCLLHY
ncbi:adenine phosphoribosyltransferase [Zhouia sp. PK063]|uniref:adenine phosphoribosyltransferase n=1 Tax=Zhouia sp. PK063 TaxID=3373602 RepID=UPI0037A88C8C